MGGRDDGPLVGGEASVNPPIVGDHVLGHRKHPSVALFGEHVAADSGQGAVGCHERVVHAVYALHESADVLHVEPESRGDREYVRLIGCGGECPDPVGGHLDVGVQVNARERGTGFVAEFERMRLAADPRLDHAYAHRPSDLGGAVAAVVGHDHDVEFAGPGRREQAAQARLDDGFLVVRRNDDADRRLVRAHGVRIAAPADPTMAREESQW